MDGRPEDAEAIDNPVEQLKLLSGDDEQIARYLDALEVRGPRERELLWEISRTRPLALPERFANDHRNMVEALELLARHWATADRRGQAARAAAAGGALGRRARRTLPRRRTATSRRRRANDGLREIESVPGTPERRELRRARMDADRMVDALQIRQLGVPTFLIGGAALPIVASLGRATGALQDPVWATAFGIASLVIALAASWVILRGAAMASRRIRLATQAPVRLLWESIGWCGQPPKGQVRTFVVDSLLLTLGAWIIVPLLVGLAIAT